MYKGVLFSVLVSMLFGSLYFYVSLLTPLTGEEVLGWRVVFTAPMLTVAVVLFGSWPQVVGVWKRSCQKPWLCGVLVLNSLLLALQSWLFVWAPLNGRALPVSLGYFLMPLVMVVVGRMLYRERLSWLKKVATLLATLGVVNEFYHAGMIAWEVSVVALGFPLYFVLRRRFDLNHVGGLWYDIMLMLPMSFWYMTHGVLSWEVLTQKPMLYVLIPGLGLLGTVGWVCYALANRLLPISLFGLLGYLEPLLLVLVSLLLGESISPHEWPTYILIWLSILLLMLEGVRYAVEHWRTPVHQVSLGRVKP